ncbi:retinoid-inducible serine carboxypeptidase-like isoform X1 [Asterias rubens]|uniref:retinoid-inducible serine carboxypeptidase-like isoform X1 n=1 Tax=Asterias rubens TaxID=7604 RepID=UPI0014556351|nr:retinoid-inducible serine carboxypeptidase-like isoform X1 [Asterias rubens]
MKSLMFLLLTILVLSSLSSGFSGGRPSLKSQANDEKETWAYVNVRQDAYMFWWLYYARTNWPQAPLIIWLQGGPGGSSTGFGNFMEIGPQDVNLNPRNLTWIETASVLFIDNPVGTGYSYVTSDDAYTTNNEQIAEDLITTLTAFYKHLPAFQKNPLYIFSESYGGKMTAGFSLAITKAIIAGTLSCNFQGLAMGDSWISPIDSVNSWGPYLHSISLLDGKGLRAVQASARAVEDAFNKENYSQATELWSATEDTVDEETFGVDFYNILNNYGESLLTAKERIQLSPIEKLYRRHVSRMQTGDLDALMNGQIKKQLGIPDNVTWGGQSSAVFSHLSGDFMKPVYNIVDELLNSSKLSVVVYSGQLDLIVDTVGTEAWVKKLQWPGLPVYNNTSWKPVFVVPDKPAAFRKQYKNFSFYWIMKAGHMVPSDAPETAYKMMQQVTGISKT